jgi:hypothetical protein
MPDGVYFQIGKLDVGPTQLLIFAGTAVLFVAALILAQMYWKRRLTTWAESEHLQLVNFRYAWFYEGPSAWTRSRNQHVFRVVTKDRDGLTRYCWIMFGTFWGFTWGEPITKVEWSDADD